MRSRPARAGDTQATYKTPGQHRDGVCDVRELWGLTVFGLITSGTPGPNNAMLWTSGLNFGLRRSLPHVLGTALGIGTLATAAAAGIAALVTAVPGLETAMKVFGSAYLLWLAWRIAGSGAARAATLARPLSVRQALAFQLINPKVWLYALGAMTAFLPNDLPVVGASALVVVNMMLVAAATATVWAAGGTALRRVMRGDRLTRIVNGVLAALLAASVTFIWL